ncbi:recBCD enzyme subunit RecB, P-loop containing nucleoside triphosphate hydrolase [Artemisia annua]|uniref:RecBCD enzyme subunit RecB, P-loop containing nucleoside triphosphate hydrolase n=1 Tax=Artemisia annua TaxID=35608 RepID=A0A2U1KB19_ARTAN|nr:recBCD enzyme subunit RecB, P-loop containing nucleoside triphosphate hydrolase [Artemisia annua]
MEDTYRSVSNPYRSMSNRNQVNRHKKTPHHYIDLHSFVHILDRLLFMASFSSSIFFTKKSSFLGWFENILSNDHTPLTYTVERVELPYVKFEHILMFLIKVIQRILLNKEDTKSWILGSDIDVTYYHPLLALRLVMMLSLLCLKVPLHCNLLLDLLTGRDNIGDLLPKKFVSKLEMNRTGSDLNLNPEVVAKAFKSIGDPLLIVNVFSEKSVTRIVAPGAIFVGVRNTKNDVMSLLFSVNNKDCDCTCSANVGAGNTISHSLEEIYHI